MLLIDWVSLMTTPNIINKKKIINISFLKKNQKIDNYNILNIEISKFFVI